MINQAFKKKILNNLKENKNCFFSDKKSKVYYREVFEKHLEFNKFLIKNGFKQKKILSVIYNQTGVNFWVNFINSYLANFTVMPLEKNSKNFEKIEKYFDLTIIFNGEDIQIKKNNKKKNNKIFEVTEYISSTSGSTGNPKMILHKFDSIVKNSIETSSKINYKKKKKLSNSNSKFL